MSKTKIKTLSKEDFSGFYNQYADEIYRFILSKTNQHHIAEVLLSETFLKGWQYLLSNKAFLDSPRAFFYQIARNLVIDFYRNKQKEAILVEKIDNKSDKIEARTADFSLENLRGQNLSETPIGEALFKLKDKHREVLVLRYVEDLPISEIAKILKNNPIAVRVAIHRALGVLRKVITEQTQN